MNGDDRCRCGHERRWHNACSKCLCPWFLDALAPAPRAIVRAWKADRVKREAKEGTD